MNMTTRKITRTVTRIRNAYKVGYVPDEAAEELVDVLDALVSTATDTVDSEPGIQPQGDTLEVALSVIVEHESARCAETIPALVEVANSDTLRDHTGSRAALIGALTACIKDPTALDLDARTQLWRASTRAQVFPPAERLTLKILSFPYQAHVTTKLLRATSFSDSTTIVKTLARILFDLREADITSARTSLDALFTQPSRRACEEVLGCIEEREELVFLIDVLGARIFADPSWHQPELFAQIERHLLRDAIPLVSWLAIEGEPRHVDRACELVDALGSRDDQHTLDHIIHYAIDHDTVALAEHARDACSRRPPPISALYKALHDLARTHQSSSTWTFSERQLLHHCHHTYIGPSSRQATQGEDDTIIADFLDTLATKAASLDELGSAVALETLRVAFDVATALPNHYIEAVTSRACTALMSKHSHLREIAADSLYRLATQGRLQTTRSHADRCIAASAEYPSHTERRENLLVCALPYHLEPYALHLDAFGIDQIPHTPHTHILGALDSALARGALDTLYAHCSETQLRGLIGDLDMSKHERFFTTWITLTKRVTASTRKIINQQLAATEANVIEPYFAHTAGSAVEDDQVRIVAIDALGRLGTRASVALLMELSSTRQFRDEANLALASIQDRYPASDYADAGSLTLSEHDPLAGALSRALETEHALTLYREIEALVGPTTHNEAPPRPSAISRTPRTDLARLSAPPRDIRAAAIAYYLLGSSWKRAAAVPMIALGTTSTVISAGIDPAFGLMPWFITAVGIISLIASVLDKQSKLELKLLEYGHIAMAELDHVELEQQKSHASEDTTHHYKLRFTTETGEDHVFMYSASESVGALEDEALEPVLYIMGDDQRVEVERPLDTFALVRIGEHGAPTITPSARWMLLIQALSVIASILVMILALA